MTGALVLEHGTPTDLPEVLAIERDSYTNPWSEKSLRDALAQLHGYQALVARAGGEPRAAGRGVLAYCIFQDVAVAAAARRQGHARSLVRRALAIGRDAGARCALLEVRESNQAARGLYASLGFSPTGLRRGYYVSPTEDAVLLRLPLP